MDADVARLAAKVWALHQEKGAKQRILIGIAGIPGSGKTTLARKVAIAVNDVHQQCTGSSNSTFAADVPMDGYHFPRAHLAAVPDPATAIHRRGAAFTFDAEGFYQLICRLREPLGPDATTICAPSFDHAVKDPVADGIAISPTTMVVIVEGNYLCLDREPWKSAAQLFDELWFLEVDREVARSRLVKRHVASGICPDEEAARHRISSTDSLNADDILENRLPVDEVLGCT